MHVWGDQLIVFGGAGEYIEKLKVHESYKDIRFYNILTQKWEPEAANVMYKKFVPQKRYYHAAAIYGGMFLLHGGWYSENKEALKGFSLYDLREHTWIGATQPRENKHVDIGPLYSHTLTAIQTNAVDRALLPTKHMWVKQQKCSVDEERKSVHSSRFGFYLFGGMN